MLRFRSQQNEQSYHVRYAYATKSMHTRAATLAPSTPLERIHPGWSCEAGRPDSQGLILLPLCCRATGIFVRSYSPLTPLSPPSEAQTSLRGSLALSLSLCAFLHRIVDGIVPGASSLPARGCMVRLWDRAARASSHVPYPALMQSSLDAGQKTMTMENSGVRYEHLYPQSTTSRTIVNARPPPPPPRGEVY